MVKSHYPRCLQCFPTQENLTTKTLNPKFISFVFLSFSLFKLSSKNWSVKLKSCSATDTIVLRLSQLSHDSLCTTQSTQTLSINRVTMTTNCVTVLKVRKTQEGGLNCVLKNSSFLLKTEHNDQKLSETASEVIIRI
jgi:Na+-translocating ferredoxin:NAD+ oxidoreductase RnfD subunit